jgi:hypothetical protein
MVLKARLDGFSFRAPAHSTLHPLMHAPWRKSPSLAALTSPVQTFIETNVQHVFSNITICCCRCCYHHSWTWKETLSKTLDGMFSGQKALEFNLLNPTGYVMHHQFNIQKFYILPILHLCVLYLSQDKQQLQSRTIYTIGFYNRDEKCLLRGTKWVF